MTPSEVLRELAPTGVLRAGINLGNPVLAQGTPDAPTGITVDLARELAKRTGLKLEMVPFDAAGKTFEALTAGKLDLIFLAIEPARAMSIEFTPPYVLIEGVFLVSKDSPLTTNEEVDRAAVRIGVNKNSAYDLFLSRTLKHATLVRGESGVDAFLQDKLEAAAGIKQPLSAFAARHPDTRLLPGRFMEIRQAMGVPKGRLQAAQYLRTFIEEMKASGFVMEALKRANQPDATVAPPQ